MDWFYYIVFSLNIIAVLFLLSTGSKVRTVIKAVARLLMANHA